MLRYNPDHNLMYDKHGELAIVLQHTLDDAKRLHEKFSSLMKNVKVDLFYDSDIFGAVGGFTVKLTDGNHDLSLKLDMRLVNDTSNDYIEHAALKFAHALGIARYLGGGIQFPNYGQVK